MSDLAAELQPMSRVYRMLLICTLMEAFLEEREIEYFVQTMERCRHMARVELSDMAKLAGAVV